MNYLIYISTSVKLFSDQDLTELLEQCRVNNSKTGITGMLLYSKGTFFQVLEGEGEAVNVVFEKIRKDDRHKGIIKLKAGSLAHRNFPEWSMAFTTTIPNSLSTLPGFVDPAKEKFLYQYDNDHPAVNLLRSFAMDNKLMPGTAFF
jgi:hypothetical protein